MKNKQILLICVLLAVATLAAFRQLRRHDFLTYDDRAYVTENIHIRHGITMDAIRWAFTTGYASNWHPLTWVSHMLDIQLFGLDPHRHHLVNLLFHTANTLLLFYVFQRMTKAPWKSAFIAALFALHPLHVESVAWVAERKDVLSTLFWMLTMAAYVHYVERLPAPLPSPGGRGGIPTRQREGGSLGSYLAVVLFFALGLMAKPMLVTLPFILLLLDYWPLGRMSGIGPRYAPQMPDAKFRNSCPDVHLVPASVERSGSGIRASASVAPEPFSTKKKNKKSSSRSAAQRAAQSSVRIYPEFGVSPQSPIPSPQSSVLRPLLFEKIPLFALSALSCIVTFIAQQKGGSVRSIQTLPISPRIANAFVSYIDYILKTIWPSGLAVFYPYPKAWSFWQTAGAALLFLAITVGVVLAAKRYRYLLVGWLWYAGTLLPVIGLVQVGSQARADRYTYIPLTGLFIMAAWGIPELLGTWRHRKKSLIPSSALILACCFIITGTQLGHWLNSFTLFDHAANVTSNNYCAFFNRGIAYRTINDYEHAIMDYDRAIQSYPKFAHAFNDRGNAYFKLGNIEQAINDYDMAISLIPEFAEAYNNRGFAYRRLGNYAQAINDFSRAIDLDPEYAVAYYGRGNSYYNLGNLWQAISDYDKAIGADPVYPDAYNNRGLAYSKLGEGEKAVEDVKKAANLGSKEAMELLKSKGLSW